ncbi:MAG: (2Fe-2S)-binding protein [Ignavibacteria bacterium]|jgi:NADH-quinone oxidoreductase subunit G|nr:(2Fe-2S)-binding protein [Ignavibacteria bacterium]
MNFYLDNNKLEADKGETIIAAAARNGIEIPHFCWHPELSLGGNCRMCLVEVGTPKRNADGAFAMDDNGEPVIAFMPKLQIACNTVVSEGMHVNTMTQKCIDARKSVMEFILINHPLDCPICDEAGDCKLQRYSIMFSTSEGSRFCEKKNAQGKRIEWNEHIMFDAERCIHCGRCGRFGREIAKEDVLSAINRGDKVTIGRFNDAPLTNAYSMNLIDICPVGALTSRDFRFKARVWEMSFNDSICPGCSRGCNISIGVRNNEVLRVQPLVNMDINKHWMCDAGRLQTPDYINEKRLLHPQVKSNDVQEPSYSYAIKAAILKMRFFDNANTYILVSPLATNETLHLVKKLAGILGISNICYIQRMNKDFGDDFLKRNEVSPNHFGCERFGIQAIEQSELASKISSGAITNMVCIDEDFAYANDVLSVFSKLESSVVLSAKEIEAVQFADVVLPVATFAEEDGSWTNCDGVVQHFLPAIVSGDYLSRMDVLRYGINQSRLDKFGADNDKWYQKEESNIMPSWWVLQEMLCGFGSDKRYKTAKEVFDKEIFDSIK